MNLQDFTEEMCPESVFVQSLTVDNDESINYYHWNGLRLFLASYEEKKNARRKESWNIEKILISRNNTNKDKLNDYLSREHIWASKNRQEDFPENFIDKRRLGNFVLIGLSSNIQLKNNDIDNKVDFLVKNSSISMLQVKELQKILNDSIEFAKDRRERKTKNFYKEIATFLIDRREEYLIKFALKRWKFPTERMGKFSKVDSFEADEMGMSEKYFWKDR